MINTYAKRTLALVLTVVMLVSCWVFVAPTQSTAATAGNYYVEIDVNVSQSGIYVTDYVGPYFHNIKKTDWKNTTTYSGYSDMAGITLFYKDDNGTKTETAENATIGSGNSFDINTSASDYGKSAAKSQTVFDHQKFKSFGLGRKDTVQILNNGSIESATNIAESTGNYTIVATITGFPTAFAIYNLRNGYAWEYGDFQITALRIAPANNTTDLTTLWSGGCKVSNQSGNAPSRYIVNMDGTAGVWYPSTLSFMTSMQSTNNNYVYVPQYNAGNPSAELQDTPGTGSSYNQVTNDTVNETANQTYRRAWAAPSPVAISGDDSVSVNTDGETSNTSTYTLANPVKDQYGVNWYADASWGEATTQNGVSFSDGTLTVPASSNRSEDYSITLNATCGNDTDSKTVNIGTFDYNVTFYEEDGETVLRGEGIDTDTQVVDYGASAVAPAAQTKAPDYDNHYSFDGWSGYTSITSGAQNKSIVASFTGEEHDLSASDNFNVNTHTLLCSGCAYTREEAHSLGEAEVIEGSEPTCTETGTGSASCEYCDYSTNIEIAALGHDFEQTCTQPGQSRTSTGFVYFQCSRCEVCSGATAVVDEQGHETGEYTKNPTEYENYSEMDDARSENPDEFSVIPAPDLNNFTDYTLDPDGFRYQGRGASLKIAAPYDYTDTDTRQGMRFTASLHVPDGVELGYSETGNCIIDFGFLYSQETYITKERSYKDYKEVLTLENVGKKNVKAGVDREIVYKMSVEENNGAITKSGARVPGATPFDGSNWTGVTAHTERGGAGTTLTFNLVVNIKAYNWATNYCAKPYIKYRYNGMEFTVYDTDSPAGYYRNVAYVAQEAYNSSSETQKVKNYCLHKILEHLPA